MRHGGRASAQTWARSFPALLLRSFVTVLVLGALLVMAALHSAAGVTPVPHRLSGTVPWKDSWSARYPGCVSVLLWPQDERPVAVVARRPDGTVTRVRVRGPHPFAAVPNGAQAVGACR